MKFKIASSYVSALIVLALSWTISCTSIPLSTQNKAAKEFYLKGRSFEKKGMSQWRSALDAYRRAVRIDNNFAEANAALARVYDGQGLYRKAAENYGKALLLDSRMTELYLPYGKALFNTEEYESAYISLQRYTAAYPDNIDGVVWLAETARALNDPGAEVFFLKLTELDSSSLDSWISLARFYYDEKDYARAIPVYDRVVKTGKAAEAGVYYEFGDCLLRMKLWELALNQFDRAAAIGFKDDLVNEYARLIRLILKGQFNENAFVNYLDARSQMDLVNAVKDKRKAYEIILSSLKEAIRIEPNFTLVLTELGRINFILGKDEEALGYYEKLIQQGRMGAFEYGNTAYLYFRRQDWVKAKEYYQRSLELDNRQVNIRDYMVTVQKLIDGKINKDAYRYYEKGTSASSPDSAEYYLQLALSVDSSYYEAYMQLGLLRMRTGKYKLAETSFVKGVTFTSDPVIQKVFHYNLGLTYSQIDFHDKAIQHFNKAVELDSLDFDAMYYLAKTYADKSDMTNAVKTYDRLIVADPDYFRPTVSDMQTHGLGSDYAGVGDRFVVFDDSLRIGQTNTYTLKVKSKNDALIGADANGDLSRELTIVFREQVQDITDYGEVEFALDIISIDGYALTSKERSSIGQRLYLRMSDVYGVTNIYGLLESDPHALPRFVIAVMEDLHGAFLRKRTYEGEMWKSNQYVFKLGSIDAVTELEEISDGIAYGKKYYGITGSYDAARYGEQGRISIQHRGVAELEFDSGKRLIRKLSNNFSTKEFNEFKATTELQEASYSAVLTNIKFEKLEPPKKVVIENIPYVKQHGPQCAAASLSMVLSYYNHYIDQDDIYSVIKSDYAGAQSNDILSYPRSLGTYKSFGYIGTIEDLKERIDQGIPVLVFLTPFGYGHVVVVIGYDESKHQIIMHDPTVANNQAVSYDDFLQEWRQSGNECAIIIPFDKEINVTEGPITTGKAVELKWQGDKAIGEHQYEKAMSKYRDALTILPTYESAMEGIMLIHLQKDNYDQASAVLDTLLQLNPTSIELVLRRASLMLSQNDYDKVLQITKKAKQLDESNIINYVYTASALFAQKKYDEAIAEIKQAIRINPLTSTPRNLLSGYLAETGDFEQAYEQAQFTIRYEPENIGNYLSLSGLYQTEVNNRFLTAQKKWALLRKSLEAADFVKAANPSLPNLDQIYADFYTSAGMQEIADSLFYENIRKFPEENGAYNNLAWRYATDAIRLPEAEKLSQKSIELSQRNPYYFDTMGWIHFKMGIALMKTNKQDSANAYFKKAEDEFKSTIEYDIYSDFAYRHLGILYQKWGRTTESKAQFEIVLGMLPDKARVYTDIAKDFEEAELPHEAIEYYLRAIENRPSLDFAAYRLSCLYVKTGKDLKRAMDFAQQAWLQDSTNFLYKGLFGIIYYHKNDFKNAKMYLEQAVESQRGYLDKEAAANHYYLGLVYRELKQPAESKMQFKEYLQRAPQGEFAQAVIKLMK
ncbi:tetratricopeptide repeat protein [bacterium]|nr:MAG: tetratricopeptide repeat protein [bacterium]